MTRSTWYFRGPSAAKCRARVAMRDALSEIFGQFDWVQRSLIGGERLACLGAAVSHRLVQ